MAQDILQTFPTEEAGTFVDGYAYNSTPEKAQVVSTSTQTIQVAQAVKIVAGVNPTKGVKLVDKITVPTDAVFGFVMYNTVKNSYGADDCIPMISMPDSNIKLIAGGSITAGDKLEYEPSTGKVITSLGVNPVCGIALNSAVLNDIFYVKQTSPFAVA